MRKTEQKAADAVVKDIEKLLKNSCCQALSNALEVTLGKAREAASVPDAEVAEAALREALYHVETIADSVEFPLVVLEHDEDEEDEEVTEEVDEEEDKEDTESSSGYKF